MLDINWNCPSPQYYQQHYQNPRRVLPKKIEDHINSTTSTLFVNSPHVAVSVSRPSKVHATNSTPERFQLQMNVTDVSVVTAVLGQDFRAVWTGVYLGSSDLHGPGSWIGRSWVKWHVQWSRDAQKSRDIVQWLAVSYMFYNELLSYFSEAFLPFNWAVHSTSVLWDDSWRFYSCERWSWLNTLKGLWKWTKCAIFFTVKFFPISITTHSVSYSIEPDNEYWWIMQLVDTI